MFRSVSFGLVRLPDDEVDRATGDASDGPPRPAWAAAPRTGSPISEAGTFGNSTAAIVSTPSEESARGPLVGMKLFEHPLSPYARKVKIALYEKGIAFERVFIQPLTIREGDASFPEFSAASPRLEVPCLVDGDFRCFDSTIIVDYLDEKWPETPMLSSKPEERARARMVEELSDSVLEAINWAMMEVRVFKRAEGAEAERITDCARRDVALIWAHLERELADRAWLSGEKFGRADAAAIVHVANAGHYGMAPLEQHTRLREWSARCLEVKGVKHDQADLAAFLESAGIRAMRLDPIVRRQYRDHRLEWMLRSGGLGVVLRGIENNTIHFSAFP